MSHNKQTQITHYCISLEPSIFFEYCISQICFSSPKYKLMNHDILIFNARFFRHDILDTNLFIPVLENYKNMCFSPRDTTWRNS